MCVCQRLGRWWSPSSRAVCVGQTNMCPLQPTLSAALPCACCCDVINGCRTLYCVANASKLPTSAWVFQLVGVEAWGGHHGHFLGASSSQVLRAVNAPNPSSCSSFSHSADMSSPPHRPAGEDDWDKFASTCEDSQPRKPLKARRGRQMLFETNATPGLSQACLGTWADSHTGDLSR